MRTHLQIRFRNKSQRQAVAWLIAGNDPARWIQEIALWQVETSSLRLCILAEASSNGDSGRDGRIRGVLVTQTSPIEAVRSAVGLRSEAAVPPVPRCR